MMVRSLAVEPAKLAIPAKADLGIENDEGATPRDVTP